MVEIKKVFFYSLLIISIAGLTISIYSCFKIPKIGYVRSHDLVYKYIGMKEVQDKYQEKVQAWQSNIDTLKKELETNYKEYQLNMKSLSVDLKKQKESFLQSKQNDLVQYTNSVNQKAKEEEQKMLDGVLNQVNSFTEDYGKKNGYDFILGTTLSGSILYGNNAVDITDVVLDLLNKNYKPVK